MDTKNNCRKAHPDMSVLNSSGAGWQAGFASKNITPSEPIFLAGWGSRTESSKGVSHPIYVKAMALQYEEDAPAVVITSDLLAFSKDMVAEIADAARSRFGLERSRLILSASHNHSAPVTRDVLPLYYDLSDEQYDVINEYSDWLQACIVEAIGEALAELAPARLDYGQSLAGFAVNRRRRLPGTRHLPGVVDHDVPVLLIRAPDNSLRGVMFGYACHTTSVRDDTINGDYAGYAQAAIEEAHPNATALFVAGCGGDANPLPRWEPGLGEHYGRVLAMAVEEVIVGQTTPVVGPLHAAYAEVNLEFEAPPDRASIVRQMNGKEGVERRVLENLLEMIDSKLPMPTDYSYPLQVWQFNNIHTLIVMTSEVVADYALRFRQAYGCEKTWVMAYANEAVTYIPSKRVRLEGGYEGTEGMFECGFPAPFEPEIEERIVSQVEQLVQECAKAKHRPEINSTQMSKLARPEAASRAVETIY